MGKLDLRLEDDFTDQMRATEQDARVLTIERRVRQLVHASQCENANCIAGTCLNMRKTIKHVKSCDRRIHGECPICRYFTGLSQYHAKQCQVNLTAVLT